MRYLLFLLILSGINHLSYAQLQGSLSTTNYAQGDYHGAAQIFDITSDNQGFLYYGNQKGILTYDGKNWGKISLQDKNEVFSILHENGILYVSHTSGVSIISPNSHGIPTEKKSLEINSEIKKCLSLDNKLYCINSQRLFISSSSLELNNEIGLNNLLDLLSNDKDEIIILTENSILRLIDDTHLTTIFTSNSLKFTHFTIRDDRFILVTSDAKIYELSDGQLTLKFHDPAISIQSIQNTPNGGLSLGTFANGIILLDSNFRPYLQMNEAKGIKNNSVSCQFIDREGHLWLGTANGITKLDLSSAIADYSNSIKIPTVEEMCITDKEMLYATGGGFYTIALNNESKIKRHPVITDDCFGVRKLMLKEDTLIFVSALNEVFLYQNDSSALSITEGGPYNVYPSPLDDSTYVIIHYDGIEKMVYDGVNFKSVNYIRDFSEGEPFNCCINLDGDIFIGTKPNDGIYKVNIKDLDNKDCTFEHIYLDQGLPKGSFYMNTINNKVYAGTNNGIYQYQNGMFYLDNSLGYNFADNPANVHRFNQDIDGNIWMVLVNEEDDSWVIGYSELDEKGSYDWHPEFFQRYNEQAIHDIYHHDEYNTWLGGTGGILHFDKRKIRIEDNEFKTYVRSVTKSDEVIYAGFGEANQDKKLRYPDNSAITFTFSSNSFVAEDKIMFSYKLENYEDKWSEWTYVNFKEYNLDEGNYIFKVKAKNIAGYESEMGIYRFTVLPPWYRTWWAYVSYLALTVLLILIIVRISLRQVKLQNIRLEKIVEQRTAEVVAQKAEAEHQRDLVEEKNLEILDSINYAKRLQDAILTPDKFIKQAFPESFVFYLPKDIVAGDFYWTNLAHLNGRDKIDLLAVADCTGHGVPGAMVSVVCSTALDRTIKEFKLLSPEKILDKTKDLVVNTFDQTSSDVKDGMDIALVSIEHKENIKTIKYAGANNPLWIISSRKEIVINEISTAPVISENELNLFEVKASKQPVGKYEYGEPFELNEIILQSGDYIYAFSDGYPDQFGGDKGKKFKYKPFKRLLLELSENEDSKSVKENLHSHFHQWKGNYEQIDDVCVMGIKL